MWIAAQISWHLCLASHPRGIPCQTTEKNLTFPKYTFNLSRGKPSKYKLQNFWHWPKLWDTIDILTQKVWQCKIIFWQNPDQSKQQTTITCPYLNSIKKFGWTPDPLHFLTMSKVLYFFMTSPNYYIPQMKKEGDWFWPSVSFLAIYWI